VPRQTDLSDHQVFRKTAKFLEGALPKSHVVSQLPPESPTGSWGRRIEGGRGGIGLPMERPEVECGGGHVGFGQGHT
jgi:hypothetical protein